MHEIYRGYGEFRYRGYPKRETFPNLPWNQIVNSQGHFLLLAQWVA